MEPLRPQFFVTRQNGTMVPLIAMDELPSTVIIRGVARTVSPYDISGMTGVGIFNHRRRQHVVEGTRNGFDRSYSDKSLMASSFAVPVHRNARKDSHSSSFLPTPPKSYGIQEQPPSGPDIRSASSLLIDISAEGNDTATNSTSRTPSVGANSAASTLSTAPSTTAVGTSPSVYPLPTWHSASVPLNLLSSVPGVKEYCSYWLRHGECDYAQQGCLYKHEMPLDREILARLGLRDIPRWYREKHGLASFANKNLAGSGFEKGKKMEASWRSCDFGGRPVDSYTEGKASTPTVGAAVKSTTPSNKLPTKQTVHFKIPFDQKPHATSKHTSSAPPSARFNSLRHTFAAPDDRKSKETVAERQHRNTLAALSVWDNRTCGWTPDALDGRLSQVRPVVRSGTNATSPDHTPLTPSSGASSVTSSASEYLRGGNEAKNTTVVVDGLVASPRSVAATTKEPVEHAKSSKRVSRPQRKGNSRDFGETGNGMEKRMG